MTAAARSAPAAAARRAEDMTAAMRPAPKQPTGSPLWELRAVALGRPAHVAVVGADPGVLEDARTRMVELDALWRTDSRHSDLVRLTRAPGVVHQVAPETVLLVALGVGLLDGPLDDAVVDVRHGRVGLPGPAELGPPDLARALAADLLAADLADAGVAGMLVSVGTCSRAEAAAPDRDGWLVRVAGRDHRLRRGGLAALEGASTAFVADEAWQALAAARTGSSSGRAATRELWPVP